MLNPYLTLFKFGTVCVDQRAKKNGAKRDCGRLGRILFKVNAEPTSLTWRIIRERGKSVQDCQQLSYHCSLCNALSASL